MKKRFRKWALLLFTLLLAGAGAAMPFAASLVQDARQTDPEVRSFASFRLTLRQKSDLSAALRLLSGGSYAVAEAQQSEDAALTRAGAVAAAEEALAELLKHGLLDKGVYGNLELPRVWPQTVIPDDGSASLPTWTVQWDSPEIYMWLDDATGKALWINLPDAQVDLPPELPSAIQTDRENKYNENVLAYSDGWGMGMEEIHIRMENWRVFLESYYGAEVQDMEELWFDHGVRFLFYFDLEDGGGPFPMSLNMYPPYGFSSLYPALADGL